MGWTFHRLGLLLCVIFGAIAVLVSFFLIFMHATHYLKPWEQRQYASGLFSLIAHANKVKALYESFSWSLSTQPSHSFPSSITGTPSILKSSETAMKPSPLPHSSPYCAIMLQMTYTSRRTISEQSDQGPGFGPSHGFKNAGEGRMVSGGHQEVG
jgi:Organic solute transporter Ostalpha